MLEARILTHEEVTALAAIVRRRIRDDKEILANRTPVVDGYCVSFDDFIVVTAKYPLQEQYVVQVWVEDAALLIAQTDCYVNWPVARLLYEFIKDLWTDPVTEDYYRRCFDDLGHELDQQLDCGRRVLAEETRAGKDPRA